MEAIRVLYVEDEESLGMIVKESMESRGFDVLFCKNAKEGLQAFKTMSPEICILDVMMPGMDGFEMAKEIRTVDKNIPIIFLTAKSQTSDVVKGFELGAHDYIKKPFSIEELLVRMQFILRREKSELSREVMDIIFNIGNYKFHTERQTLLFEGNEKKLTHRETEILRMLCENRNQVLERDAVLMKLWGDNSFFNARSMDVFITKLRKYLIKDSRIEIVNVRGIGYKLID
ncbi:MAG: response regulator transcription factor [Bacteroidetes bacterium]|jgi:two-component system, OmpR family, response regulator VicR|nr:response regulator transcription factor [Bacteroidota bacterium]MBT6687764.1 response regulator transcription factor [Bacteroidota bacterium]MBT7143398.1 response regulator transcription factor [Bacteroidota bacterium]MBT7492532.1 response regulator transcription factor [Bacteroidota bacterium]